jgi:bifunctional non-homologous end joining protein LigD
MAKEQLGEYSAKRKFEATPEPAPEAEARSGPLLFVIQRHAARRLHYDLRLECDGVLKSWAVPKGPSPDPSEKRLAVQTEDHPISYASFEGVIPQGQYGAGEMIVWDCGLYSPDEGQAYWFHDRAEAERRVREGLEAGKLSFLLRGEKTKGSYALVRTKEQKNWLLIKHKDRFVAKADLTAQTRSVLPVPGIAVAELAPTGEPKPLPADLAPMQSELGEAPFNSADWMWEPKLDGYRALAIIDGGKVQLRSRRGLEQAEDFPQLAAELGRQAVSRMVLDGEIVAFDAAGKPSFNALQNRSPRTVFYCFDLVNFEGIDLRKAPYADRRRYLAQCLLPSPQVQLVHAAEDGVALHAAALASGLEGVMGKRKDSRYESGRRSAAWLKIKATQSAEFVIGGYTTGKGTRAPLGAILVGYWDQGKLHYASHVGSGFDGKNILDLQKRLASLHSGTRPFAQKPPVNAPVQWVRPELAAEIKFQAWTDEGSLRAPVFLRLRDDVDPRELRRPGATARDEMQEVLQQLESTKNAFALAVGPHQIRLTSLDKVYWPADPKLKQPALTKRDLIRYFAQVSPFILPHLADRPLTMIRMPEGIGGQRFFQKHWEQERPAFTETITVFSGHKDESHDYLLCNNLPTLLWLAQSGTLEFHVWHSRARPGSDSPVRETDYASSMESLERSILNFPDYVVFDIDPYIYSGKEAPGEEPELNNAAFEKGKEVAFRLRELLQGMSLEPVVKTSGKTGLHVFVPIRRTIDFDAAREVSQIVGNHLVRRHPQDITQEWSVPKRTGKIFMDYNMNVRGKTLNVAYSPRGAPGGPVSMPLSWEELAGAHPLDFTITNAAARLAQTGDCWRDALSGKQSLERALERVKA